MARYDIERFSHGLGRTKKFESLRDPISEAFYPKLDSLVTGRAWPARPANTILSDLNRMLDQIVLDVSTLESWIDHFKEAATNGFAIDVSSLKSTHRANAKFNCFFF